MNASERSPLPWRRHDDDCIRSEDSTYWVSRARSDRWPGGYVYTAAWRPQDAKRDGEHLGCYGSADEAKSACEAHRDGRGAAIGTPPARVVAAQAPAAPDPAGAVTATVITE